LWKLSGLASHVLTLAPCTFSAKGERREAKRLAGKKKKRRRKKKVYPSKQQYPQVIRCGVIKDPKLVAAFAEETRITKESGFNDRKMRIGYSHAILREPCKQMLKIATSSAAYRNAFKVRCLTHYACGSALQSLSVS